MGLDSLRHVKGPGEIIVKYGDKDGRSYYFAEKDSECFSKKEIQFYALHPQFNGQMYKPCDTDDPCMKFNARKYVMFNEYNESCTIAFGIIQFTDPLTWDSPNLERVRNIEVIVGAIKIYHTLLSKFNFLPKLKVIYSTESANYGKQKVYYDNNFYLKEVQLPSLTPERKGIFCGWADPCRHLPQFQQYPENCDDCSYNPETSVSSRKWHDDFFLKCRIFTYACVILGMAFAVKAIAILLYGCCSFTLYSSRYSIVLVIVATIMASLHNGIIYEEQRQAPLFAKTAYIYPAPMTTSLLLANSAFFFLMKVFAAVRNASTFIIPCLYLEKVCFKLISYVTPSVKLKLRFSFIFHLLVFILFIFIGVFHWSNLVVFMKGMVLNGGDKLNPEPIFTPFVMHKEGMRGVNLINLETNENGMFSQQFMTDFHKLNPDILGLAFPAYNFWIEMFLVFTALPYHFLQWISGSRGKGEITFLLMYLLLCANRFRWYISGLLQDDYCVPRTGCRDVVFGATPLVVIIAGKIPYFLFAAVSFFCWIFARECHISGARIQLKEKKQNKQQLLFTSLSTKTETSSGNDVGTSQTSLSAFSVPQTQERS